MTKHNRMNYHAHVCSVCDCSVTSHKRNHVTSLSQLSAHVGHHGIMAMQVGHHGLSDRQLIIYCE